MKRYVPNFRPPSKYRAQKTTMDGITFDSKAEAARYQQLHPAKSEYVNIHPYCLHLWRPLEREIPMPPVEFV